MDSEHNHSTNSEPKAGDDSMKAKKTMTMKTSSTGSSKWTKEVLQRFWDFMGQTYGKQWFLQNGTEPPEPWKAFLRSITPAQARDLIETCLKDSPYPPHLGALQHYNNRTVLNEHGLDYVPQHLRPDAKTHVTLPKPKADKIKTAEEMQKIRQMLK